MITEIRVQFKDVDLSHRIHYTSLFNYFEVADHGFFRAIGHPYKELIAQGLYFPRVHVECDYRGMIQYDDVLHVKTSISKLGSSSFAYLFEVMQSASGIEVAKGQMVIVCVDKHSGKPVQLPQFLREKMTDYLVDNGS